MIKEGGREGREGGRGGGEGDESESIVQCHLRKIIPMREMVAGEAQERSWVSKRKLTLGPNWILSPDGMVSSL